VISNSFIYNIEVAEANARGFEGLALVANKTSEKKRGETTDMTMRGAAIPLSSY
jgi:hypothetical protein